MAKKVKDEKEKVSAYISSFPPKVAKGLKQIRAIIKKAAPDAVEVISYSMPAFRGNKILLWYAGNKNHWGLYVYPDTIKKFAKELKDYSQTKSAIHLPHDEPLPVKLIQDIVKYRLEKDVPAAKKAG